PAQPPPPEALPPPSLTGRNPLVDISALLLSLASQLRTLSTHPDINSLKKQTIQSIQSFERDAQKAHIEPETIVAARYALCSFIDEVILNTPWGSGTVWSHESLLVLFHKETSGGEKFFLIIDRATEDAEKNINLLELLYLIISLGFEGKFRVVQRGGEQLAQQKDKLYRVIQNQRGATHHTLSPRWKSSSKGRAPLHHYISPWVIYTVTSATILVCFLGFSFSINQSTTALYQSLYDIGTAPTPHQPVTHEPLPTRQYSDSTLRIREALTAEINRGFIEISENNKQLLIRLTDPELFSSGSDLVNQKMVSVIYHIAEVIQHHPLNRVMVTGHTDNQPIFTAQFQSNWALSQARADSITNILHDTGYLADKTVTAKGLADNHPLVPNSSIENRARNRRIELVINKPINNFSTSVHNNLYRTGILWEQK
ncbi:MAG: OmpA family protein, partial [Gammaproteobacteria bacterium]|nr:OmpA family protein [Gammaproteobacteria bacterium]